ncbi:MAG: S9 family peptidase [Porphyromonas sp.]|uniref:S9 family peptidase n=1 Tax=Porphyromonas sp. TaxID=1924944 RepID=UPI001A5EB17E|nr:S9 family peptidase [Porphyromonas sp.]MBL6452101.1 S9 family peptidase [Porphyromonas sp.]
MTAQQHTQQMTPELLLTLPRVGSYALAPSGKQVVYNVSQPSIQDNNSRTSIYLINSDGTGRTELTAPSSSSEYTPRWSRDGKQIYFMRGTDQGMQLFARTLSDGVERQLTAIDGGIVDYLFSPDETTLLYVQDIKARPVVTDVYPDLDKADARIIEDLMYKHWDEWVSTMPHPFIAKVTAQPITEGLDLLAGEPYEAPMRPFNGIEDIAFSPDGNLIAYACRKKTGLEYSLSTNSDIYLYNVSTGETTNVSEGLMGYDTNPVFSPDGRSLIWIGMEHDGYESDLQVMYLYDLAKKQYRPLTADFEYNVSNPTWSADSKTIYFITCREALTHLYSYQLSNGKIKQITDGQYDYTGFDMNDKGVCVASRQSMTYPTELYMVNLRSGKATELTTEDKPMMSQLGDLTCEKRWMTTTDGGKMLTWVLYPPHFDKNKRYPSLLYCQGGPQNTISQFWSYRWNPRIMAEQGYIVILPNRHGVPGFGKAWNEQISGDYSGQNIQDYLTAADLMRQEPFIDPDRMGAVGASYGGYSVYYLAGVHEGRFSAFIAHAGIFNLEAQYLETEEKWFANWDMGGAPWEKDNATAQRTFANSPHKLVDKWDTPILIIHGEHDFRILASQGMMAFDAAKMRGVPTKMLLFPEETHWVLKPQNALLWQRTFFDWLDRWLKK